jgi:Flp pilus assembly protein TadD
MKRWSLAMLAVPLACAHGPAQRPSRPAQVAPAKSPEPEVSPEALLAQARDGMRQRSWETARELLEKYLARRPQDASALVEAGFVAEQLSDAEAAADLYRRALASDPQVVAAALNLARLLRANAAESVLRQALQAKPADPRLLDALGTVLRQEKKLDEAEAAARKVLERHPKDAGAWRVLAAVEADRGHARLAESALNNARKLDPGNAAIVNELGLLAIRRDDVVAARALFAEAARLDPAFSPAWVNLGALALRYRDYPAAAEALSKAVETDPARAESHLALAWALEGLRRPREARAEYEKVLAADASNDDALYGRALALKAEGDLAGASAALRAYLERKSAAHVKEAQQQLAAIALRLQGARAAKSPPAAAELDMSKLPQTQAPDAPQDHVR